MTDLSRLPTGGTIRKLTVGTTKTEGITYQVGTMYRDKQCTRIVRDENSQFLFGAVAYYVYADVKGTEKLWKIIERQPVTVEFDLDY